MMMHLLTGTTIARGASGSLRCITASFRTSACAPSLSASALPLPSHSHPIIARELSSSRSDTPSAKYQCVHVFVSVKPGTEQEFIAATLANARASSQEPGIARFDILQREDDPTKFVFVEVYKNADAPAAHKSTSHYLKWRDSVEHMMAEPRRAIKFINMFPITASGWDYGDGVPLE